MLYSKHEGRRPLRQGEDNIKMDLREVGRGQGLALSALGYRHVAGFFECGN
jgi:hypothetical protein